MDYWTPAVAILAASARIAWGWAKSHHKERLNVPKLATTLLVGFIVGLTAMMAGWSPGQVEANMTTLMAVATMMGLTVWVEDTIKGLYRGWRYRKAVRRQQEMEFLRNMLGDDGQPLVMVDPPKPEKPPEKPEE